MKVKELIEVLQKCNPEMVVLFHRRPEEQYIITQVWEKYGELILSDLTAWQKRSCNNGGFNFIKE
jgi:hypothetical protein